MTQPIITRRIADYGDSGLLVTFEGGGAVDRWTAARGLRDALTTVEGAGVVDMVSSFDTLFVTIDPVVSSHDAVRTLINEVGAMASPAPTPAEHRLIVSFAPEDAPDLEVAAEAAGVNAAELVRLLCAAPWTVRLLGSPIGAPLMDRDDIRSRVTPVPRRRAPRTRLPAGSLGLSGHQAIVYPVHCPGGWQLVGRVRTPLLQASQDPRPVLRAGDRVRFAPEGADS